MAELVFLSEHDIREVAMPTADVLAAVEQGLLAHWRETAVLEPTVSFKPVPGQDGLLSVVSGSLADANLAMVKTVGTFPDNHARGLVSNPGLITLMDAETGIPRGIIDAAPVTTMRTAAVTAIGAKYLAGRDAGILGCIGSRGIALQAARYIAELFDLLELRIHSPNRKNRDEAVRVLENELNLPVVAHDSWRGCLENADIMIDGSSLSENQAIFPAEVMSPGATLIAYGFNSSMPAGIFDRIDRVIMDRWVPGNSGAFGPQVAAGEISEANIDALMGEIISGDAVGRTSPSERVLFWHRGVAACDIALASMLLERADAAGIGQRF